MAAGVQPEIADRASRHVRLFGVSLLAALVVTPLPLPARLSGLGFAGLASVVGVQVLLDLSALRRAGRAAPGWVGAALGLGLAVFLTGVFGLQVALYPLLAEQERCLSRAVTHLDRDQCSSTFEQRQREILDRFEGRR